MGDWKCVNCGKPLKQPGKYCMDRPCRRVYCNKYILGRLSSDKGFRDRFYASQRRYYLRCLAKRKVGNGMDESLGVAPCSNNVHTLKKQ